MRSSGVSLVTPHPVSEQVRSRLETESWSIDEGVGIEGSRVMVDHFSPATFYIFIDSQPNPLLARTGGILVGSRRD